MSTTLIKPIARKEVGTMQVGEFGYILKSDASGKFWRSSHHTWGPFEVATVVVFDRHVSINISHHQIVRREDGFYLRRNGLKPGDWIRWDA